ncbi:MAG: hypothetical protein JWP20_968, partial [Roseomonas sp.]|nr:hypothetical protein [Roseomonas sp.]
MPLRLTDFRARTVRILGAAAIATAAALPALAQPAPAPTPA